MTTDLRTILSRTPVLLLDFDGPVCSVFAGYPAPQVADDLRRLLPALPPEPVASTSDPMDVLAYAQALTPEVGRQVEAAFADAEVRAVQSAEPTPGASEAIQNARQTGRRIAYVSNNSAACVRAYLAMHQLDRPGEVVSARHSATANRLKPHPFLVTEALARLAVDAPSAVLIGDSMTDVTAGHAAGVQVIGYANRPGKAHQFAQMSTDVITTSMVDVAEALAASDALPS